MLRKKKKKKRMRRLFLFLIANHQLVNHYDTIISNTTLNIKHPQPWLGIKTS